MRAGPDRSATDRAADPRGRPTRACPTPRRPQGDGAPRLPALLPAPLPRPHEPHPAADRRRADRRLHPRTDDRAPPAAQGLIQRIPRSQRYQLTDLGRMIAVFCTKTYVRILNPSLAELDPQLPEEIANTSDLARSRRAFERAIDQRIRQA